MKKAVYSVLKQLTGKSLPYGMLTGVRPLTIVKRLGEGTSTEEIEQYLQKEYDISGEKAHLLSTTASVQESLHLDNNAAGLYINIPFCPDVYKRQISLCGSGKKVAEFLREKMKKSEIWTALKLKWSA